MAPRFNFLLHAFLYLALATTSFSLSPKFYDNLCPQALPAIKRVVEAALHREPRMGASLLRLHFHDCFVNGCDGSLLLDSTSAFETEKNAHGNFNSVRGFEVVDQIKAEVDRVCGRPVVSCADILAVAARDSVLALGGPTWKVRLGRRDSTIASRALADSVLPSASMDLPALISNFKNQGLNTRDLVALSGGHTIGLSQCVIFRNRIYNATNIDPAFAKERRATCPRTGGNTNLAPFDPTPARFDTAYFKNLVKERGLLTSDQALFSGGSTDKFVETYSKNPNAFWADFGKSMIKMGNIKPLTGNQGQILMASPTNFLLHAFLWLALAATAFSLSPNFYHNVCPQALPAIKRVVEAAVHKERRMGASLLRLHFHDCFVNGCDGSLLLDSTSSFETEKNARGNLNSVRGFEVVDQIKAEVDRVCGRPVVSCADILAAAARDSVVALGGPTWKVRLGRRDSTTASRTLADSVLPSASMDLPALINNFKNQGLNKRDLVALSGGHTIGLSQCAIFRNRIYNATNIDPVFAKELRATCPRTGGNTNLAPFDPTPARFDTAYFKNLVKERGLLTSDQALFSGGSTDKLVETYSKNPDVFWVDFGKSMIRMGNIKPLTGKQGQIRVNSTLINPSYALLLMGMAPRFNFLLHAFLCLALATTSFSLSPKFYDNLCPQALPTIKRIVEAAVHREPRMGASLLRLHFHDCFVNGCDGSLLLDSTSAFETEKNARGNFNSVRGFEVVDQIKAEVDRVCGRPVVSCADILAVAARDSVLALGGPTWKVRLGRRDSTTASRALADSVLPSASMDLPALISNFKNQGLNTRDLVALSGGHTIGLSQCVIFRNRIYNATNIDPAFAKKRRATCPRTGGNTNLSPFDPTPARFDTAYFKNLVKERGLLTSDQALFSGGLTDKLVETYSKNPNTFWVDFGKSMIKMGNIKPLTGNQGQIRVNCRKVN
ncbi:hypothetical protein J1N35_016712 [Gossypium stocksii]|uniref:peroxidase n=1 Tax=Gossypium stocksii TaxID=47602 RepID=A0A9D4A5F9_9ROSI|nr:hypothetical protein J1N35_016712 [Gossypium stocksii]